MSALGRWRQEVSAATDETSARVAQIESIAAGEVNALAGPGLIPDGTELAVGQNPDNSIVVNADNVQVSAAIQSGSAAGATAVQPSRNLTAGAGLTGGGNLSADRTFDVGQNADNSILVSANDIQLNPAIGASVTGGFAYFANPPTNVNSATGNDANDGLTPGTALQTVQELGRRYAGRTLLPSAVTVDIALAGTFPGQKLMLNFESPGPTLITISGQMTSAFNGTIDTYTTKNATTNTRPAITDATANFPTLIRRRVRSTSGAVAGAITWIMPSAGTGATNGLIGQFTGLTVSAVSPSFATQNPVAATTYAVEDFVTQLLAYDITVPGLGTVTVRDIDFNQPAVAQAGCWMRVNGAPTNGRLFGCRFSGAGLYVFEGFHEHGACGFMNTLAGLSYGFFVGRTFDSCHFNLNTQMINGAQVGAQGCMHDGGGAGLCNLFVTNGAILEDITDRGFFGSTGALDSIVSIDDGGKYALTLAASLLWGGVAPNALNTATFAARVRSDSALTWITLPTLAGTTPGVSDVAVGGVVFTWAAVAAGVNNANNGAIAAPKA